METPPTHDRRHKDTRRLSEDRRHNERQGMGLRYPADRRKKGGRRREDHDSDEFPYYGA